MTQQRVFWLSGWVGVALVALVERHLVMANADVAWLLTVAEKVIDGGRLYVDVIETNPPISFWLYVPFVLLGRAMSVRPETLIDLGLIGAAIASVYATSSILRRDLARIDRPEVLSLAAFAILVVLPAYCFGEREHVVLIAALPALAVIIQRAKGARVDAPAVVAAGLLLGLIVCIKPHFALAIVGASLAACVFQRSLRPLLMPENLLGAALCLAYVASTLVFYPEFWRTMMPLLNRFYIPVRIPLMDMLDGGLPLLIAEIVFVGSWIAVKLRNLPNGRGLAVGAAAAMGFLLAALLQGKGWAYHFYPALGLLVLLLTAVGLGARGTPRQERNRLVPLAAVGLFFIQFGIWFASSMDLRALVPQLRAIAPHPRIASLASDLSMGFPVVRSVEGKWVERSYSRWISHHAIGLSVQPGFDPMLKPVMQAAEKADREGLVADIETGHPDVLLVERNPFDFLAWARRDPDLAGIVSCYAPAGRVGLAGADGADTIVIELYAARNPHPTRAGCPADR